MAELTQKPPTRLIKNFTYNHNSESHLCGILISFSELLLRIHITEQKPNLRATFFSRFTESKNNRPNQTPDLRSLRNLASLRICSLKRILSNNRNPTRTEPNHSHYKQETLHKPQTESNHILQHRV